ncbi:MAG: hypothetical protein K6T65_13070 [Peptococcaceae bacterium]|nr:hypothetical protein [Peptococcaceae bacterium]
MSTYERHLQNICRIVDGIFAIPSLDRFRPPDDAEPRAFAKCEGPGCNIEILSGDEYYELDGHIFCDGDCLAEWMGADKKYAPEAD